MTSESFRVMYVWSGILRSFTNVCKIKKDTTRLLCVVLLAVAETQVTGSLIHFGTYPDTVRCFASGPFPVKVNPPAH